MAEQNRMEGSRVAGRRCKKTAASENRRQVRRRAGTAMVPARFFTGTPEYAKGIVGRWGKMIPFEDTRPFLF